MGERGPIGRGQGHRRSKKIRALPSKFQEPPAPAKGLLVATERAWSEFWSSAHASLLVETDVLALRRLFGLYDERQRFAKAARQSPFVRGSKGQPVLNPALAHIRALDAEIRQLEDRFGLTPRARLRLGLTWGQARESLEALNRRLDEQDAEVDEGNDPRLTAPEPKDNES